MEIVFNSRENGACPFCSKAAKCAILHKLSGSVREFSAPSGHGLELVIYSCPSFRERS